MGLATHIVHMETFDGFIAELEDLSTPRSRHDVLGGG
jgi:hypothetical protein